MSKTIVEKVASPNPDVSIFRVGGTLGYHENEVLAKFFAECSKRKIRKLVMDFSGLGSLGGGCARIIQQACSEGSIIVCITGASKTVRNFLEKKDVPHIHFATDLQRALELLENIPAPEGPEPARSPAPPAPQEKQRHASAAARAPYGGASDDEEHAPSRGAQEDGTESETGKRRDAPEVIILGQEAEAEGTAAEGRVTEKPAFGKPKGTPPDRAQDEGADAGKDLRRKLIQYKSLFSLNSDFNRITERTKLLDVFLLTMMAQVGVESAAFLERQDGEFTTMSWKGVDEEEIASYKLKANHVGIDVWLESGEILTVEQAPITEVVQKQLRGFGFHYAAPFIVHGNFRGIVMIGKPIRRQLDQDAMDFLSILINQAALAYENTYRFEEESQRTLGLVQTLISLIEENTMSRGNTELISNYTYAMALKTHYPEDHIRDLMYGTVLRDIGMIKVSDLIVRSPRELMKEEWEIIKRHPIDGAEMLRRMKFPEHAVNIVLCHHERFNGEGYPHKLQGVKIPLGARIVSVVESYAAMLQDRATRPALTREEALNTLRENWGLRYDPEAVRAFVELVEDEIRSGEKIRFKSSEFFKM